MDKDASWWRRAYGLGTAFVASNLRRGLAVVPSPAFVLSLVSLTFSAISLYVTVLEQPRLKIFAGCNWQYGRGPGSFDEYFVIPVTVVNDGARGGTVLALELEVEKGGSARSFAGNFTLAGLNDQARGLFAPLAIAGHASASSAIVFTQRTRANPPLFDEAALAAADHFSATLKFRTALPFSYGFVDRLLPGRPTEARFEPLLRSDDLAPVLDDKLASFDACASVPSDTVSGNPK